MAVPAPGTTDDQPRGAHLVGRRPAARRLQAVRVRQGHPAARRAAPPRLRARADQAAGARPARAARRARSRTSSPVLQAIAGRAVLQHLAADASRSSSPTRRRSPATCAPTSRLLDAATRDVIEKFDFDAQIGRLDRANLLYLVVSKFAEIDLHPDAVCNVEMGYLYEELIRRFSELSNETAGEHFTPREVIRLMVNLLFIEDDDALTKPGIVRTLLDPACGTGGMLSVAEDYLRELNPGARLEVLRPGAERRDLRHLPLRHDAQGPGRLATSPRQHLHRGRPSRAHASTTCSPIRHSASSGRRSQREIEDEHDKLGFDGRFGAGLPRINDGSFLFLQHMISQDEAPPRRAAAGSPSSSTARRCSPAAAGSGESEIRRWIIENDWLEAIVALPDQLFYNTGISHLLLDRHQPQDARAPGQGPARRRPRAVHEDAQEPRQEAQGDQRRRRSPRSPASTARSRRTSGSRSSRTRRSASSGSRSSDRSASGTRSPTTTLAGGRGLGGLDEARPSRSAWRSSSRLDGARRASHRRTEPRSLDASAPLPKADRQGRLGRARGPRPRRPGHHRPQGPSRARPRPPRQRERPAARAGRAVRRGPDRAPRLAAVPRRRRRLHGGRGPPVRPRRLGRPRQDEDRLRDPAHPPLLPLRPAAPARGDRRRDQGARGGDPATARARSRRDAGRARLKHLVGIVDGAYSGRRRRRSTTSAALDVRATRASAGARRRPRSTTASSDCRRPSGYAARREPGDIADLDSSDAPRQGVARRRDESRRHRQPAYFVVLRPGAATSIRASSTGCSPPSRPSSGGRPRSSASTLPAHQRAGRSRRRRDRRSATRASSAPSPTTSTPRRPGSTRSSRKKRRMIELLDERLAAHRSSSVSASASSTRSRIGVEHPWLEHVAVDGCDPSRTVATSACARSVGNVATEHRGRARSHAHDP